MPIINQIVKGGGSSTKYGLSIDAFVGNADQNGVLQQANPGAVTITGVTDLGNSALKAAFSYSTTTSFSAPGVTALSGPGCLTNAFISSAIQTLTLNDVVEISGADALNYACRFCSYLTTLSMTSLVRVSGSGVFNNFITAIGNNTSFTTLNMPLLKEVTGYGAFGFFLVRCTALISVSLPSLDTITGQYAFQRAFDGSTSLTTLTLGGTTAIDFGGNTNTFDNMFNNCTQNITVNAPNASKTDIEAMTGYPNFGCTGTVTWNWVS